MLQVLGQGDAHHQVQPHQAGQCRSARYCVLHRCVGAGVRRVLGPAHPRGGGGREPLLETHHLNLSSNTDVDICIVKFFSSVI